jgi:hypothetical protein
MPTFGDIIVKFGFGGGFLLVAVLGILVGIVGFIVGYWDGKKAGRGGTVDNWSKFYYGFFLFGIWFYLLCLFPLNDKNFWLSIYLFCLSLAISMSLSWFLNSDSDIGFFDKDFGSKLLFSFICSVVMLLALLPAAVLENDGLTLFNFSKEQRIHWHMSDTVMNLNKSGNDVKETYEKIIKKHGYPLSPYYMGVINIRLGNDKETSENFRKYADQFQGKDDKNLWLGISAYYGLNFKEAARYFSSVDKDWVIFSLYKAGDLTKGKFSELTKNRKTDIKSSTLYLIQREVLKDESRVKSSDSAQALILERVARLEDLVKNSQFGDKDLNQEMNIETFRWVCAYGSKLVKLPEKYDPAVIGLFLCGLLPVFLLTAYTGNWLMRDYLWEKIEKRRFKLSTGKLAIFAQKFHYHSTFARNLSAKLALAEKQKGMFSEEIARIQTVMFPRDVLLGLFYTLKAKKSLRYWEIASKEKEDIALINREIKNLSGTIIPQADGEALAVIQALNKKASSIAVKFSKGDVAYLKAREFLLQTHDELVMVANIFEAKNKNQLSYYGILGVSSQSTQEEIKKGYRSVIAAVHPDRNGNNKHLAQVASMINVAYAVLSSPLEKELYDKQNGF